jgi:hypothetical protein
MPNGCRVRHAAAAVGSHLSFIPLLTVKMCMAVIPGATPLATSGKVTDATVFEESTGTVVANTYIVMLCDMPRVELRYGMVATVVRVSPGDWDGSVNATVCVDDVPSV